MFDVFFFEKNCNVFIQSESYGEARKQVRNN